MLSRRLMPCTVTCSRHQSGPKARKKTERAALKCFLHWATVCKNEGGDYQTLDEFLLAWARWVIKVEELFTDQAQMDECRQRV